MLEENLDLAAANPEWLNLDIFAELRAEKAMTFVSRPPSSILVSATPSKQIATEVSEAIHQQHVVEIARYLGYKVFHSHDSRKSEAGFPDLPLLRDEHLVVIECKSRTGNVGTKRRRTKSGREMPSQLDWLQAFGAVKRVDVLVSRPDDLDETVAVLQK